MRRLSLRYFWTCFFSLWLPASAHATVILPTAFADIVRGSELIVRGTITDVRVQMTGGRRTIESLVTARVDEAIKGATSSFVTFRVPSGQIGRYRRITVGAPEFRAGEQVVLFLRARAPELPTIFGLNQGVFRINGDRVSRRAVAVPAFIREIRLAAGGRP